MLQLSTYLAYARKIVLAVLVADQCYGAAPSVILDGCYLAETISQVDPMVLPAFAPVEAFPVTGAVLTAEGHELSTAAGMFATKLEVGEWNAVYCASQGCGIMVRELWTRRRRRSAGTIHIGLLASRFRPQFLTN
jgi:hypothetical protein